MLKYILWCVVGEMVVVASEKPDPKDKQDGVTRSADKPAHANGASRDNDRWLRSIVEHGMEIVKVVDLDGTLRYANAAFERILGRGRTHGELPSSGR